MTISTVKAGGWSIGEKLTSAQATALDRNTTYAVDKRAGQTDTVASSLDVTGTLNMNDTSKIIMSDDARIEVNVQNGIVLNANHALQSQYDGSIRLGPGTDWVAFTGARHPVHTFGFPGSGSYFTTTLSSAWYHNGRFAISTATGAEATIEIPPFPHAQGSNLAAVTIGYRASVHSPAAPATIRVFRADVLNCTFDELSSTPEPLVYLVGTGSAQTVTLVCNQNHVVDYSRYRYFVQLKEESSTGSSFGTTNVWGFAVQFGSITSHRFM